ncbi:MAG: hypothetical protein R3A52_20615 [Polyangiales bacterium]
MTIAWEPAPDVETMVMALRLLSKIPVEADGGENWPEEGVLLWVPGISARGVFVESKDGRMLMRLPSLASIGDFRFACVLAEGFGKGMVDVENDGERTVEALRENVTEWWIREQSFAVEAVRQSLQAGNSVTINGPKYSLTLDPETALELELERLPEVLREAHAPEDDADESEDEDDEGEGDEDEDGPA